MQLSQKALQTTLLWLLICSKNVFLYSMKMYVYSLENN